MRISRWSVYLLCVAVIAATCCSHTAGPLRLSVELTRARHGQSWAGRQLMASPLLRLRGGLWYSGSDSDEEDDEDDYDEDIDEEEEEPEPPTFEEEEEVSEGHKPGWNEEDSEIVPLGWCGGRYPEVFEERYNTTESRIDGPLPFDNQALTTIRDYYGLGNWTYLHGEEDPSIPTNTTTPRSILRVPLEELPEPFHWPTGAGECGVEPHVGYHRSTLGERFNAWVGTAPTVWSAKCDSPKGAVWAHSYDMDGEEWDDERIDKEFGGKEQGAWFRYITEQRMEKDDYQEDRHGRWAPGPDVYAPDVMCAPAPPGLPRYGTVPKDGELKEIFVGKDDFVFAAVRDAEPDEEVHVAFAHEWAQSSQCYPANYIDLDKANTSFHLRGSNPCPVDTRRPGDLRAASEQEEGDAAASDAGTQSGERLVPPLRRTLEAWGVGMHDLAETIPPESEIEKWEVTHPGGAADEDFGVGVNASELSVCSGQWRMSNETYGSFRRVSLIYHTVAMQPVLQVFSGPWILDECDIRCANAICIQVMYSGVVQARKCALGGTGREYEPLLAEPAVALVGTDCVGNGNITARGCLFEDIGWHGGCGAHFEYASTGLLEDCRMRRCRIAVYMAHFPTVVLRRCVLEGNVHGAFLSMCYWSPNDKEVLEGREERIRAELADKTKTDASGKRVVDGVHNGGFLEPPEGDLKESGEVGQLYVWECTVSAPVWADDNRPWVYEHDGGAKLE